MHHLKVMHQTKKKVNNCAFGGLRPRSGHPKIIRHRHKKAFATSAKTPVAMKPSVIVR